MNSVASVFPSPLIEATNGALFVILVEMLFFGVLFLFTRCREVGVRYARHEPDIRCAVGMCVFLFGFSIRIGLLWIARALQNHGFDTAWMKPWAVPTITVATIITLIGGICWIRETVPNFLGPLAWLYLATAAVFIGIGVALF